MARDTNYQAKAPSLNGPSKEDRFWQSERGQDMSRILELMDAGDRDGFNRAYEAYRQKYDVPAPGFSLPDKPQGAPRDLGPPLMLPPEAR